MAKILVIADEKLKHHLAQKRAIEMAKYHDADLHIVYFCYENLRDYSGDHDEIISKIVADKHAKAEQQLGNLSLDDLNYTFEVVWQKHIFQWINDYAEEHNPDLVLKTRRSSNRMFNTPTDWHLIRECSAPVLICAPHKAKANVLSAVDLETKNEDKKQLNDLIVEDAMLLAQEKNVESHVAYTVEPSKFMTEFDVDYLTKLQDRLSKDLKAPIADLVEKHKVSEDNVHIHIGAAQKIIPNLVKSLKIGTLVIGSVGRKGVAGKFIGNTAEKVLSKVKCDILVLKP